MFDKRKEEAAKISIKQGTATSISGSFGDSSITPFVLALKGTSLDIGIINALTGFLGPLSQLWGSKHSYNKQRKPLLKKIELWQVFLWMIFALMSFMLYFIQSSEKIVYIIIAMYLTIFILSSLIYPSWFSWMGDIIEKKNRGKYFGKRSAIVGSVGLVMAILASLFLDQTKNLNLLFIGFSILFVFTGISKFVSYIYINKQYEPKNKQKEEKKESFIKFITEKNSLSKFSWILALFNLALMIASPFFGVYMLKSLSFSYFEYTAIITSNVLFYLLFTPLIGKLADRYGSTKLFKLSLWLFATNPVFWIFIKNPLYLILGPQIISGLANATLTVATTNFVYEKISPGKRGQYISYVNILVGIGILVGSLAGGLLLNYLPISSSTFMIIFGLSAFLRALMAIIATAQIKKEKESNSIPQISLNPVHPLRTFNTDLHFLKQILK